MSDPVLEVGGVKARKVGKDAERLNLQIDEYALGPFVRIGSIYSDVLLTPDEARRLARHLRRFARRIEERDATNGA